MALPRRFGALLFACCGACRSGAGAGVSDRSLDERAIVGVVTQAGARHAVRVELARDEAQQRRGLMHRTHLADGEGMLFVFPAESRQSFWMRDTPLPLDMLFVKADGRIAGIVANAAPRTDTPRGIDEPTRFVLEVPGGWSALHGVQAGDRLELGALR